MNLAIGPIDGFILALYLAAVALIGVWVGRGQRSLDDYLLGGRELPWWAVLGSIVATETSTATFLSVPGLAYKTDGGDLRFLQLPLGFFVGRVLVAALLLPQYFRGELFTAYQVLEQRFGGATKITASGLFLVTRNVADGLRLFLAAFVLQQVLGIPLSTSIILMGVVTIIYTMVGGMKSVVWNDCLQLVVYLVGAGLALLVAFQRLPGGFDQVLQYGAVHDKWRVFDFGFDFTKPYTFWAGLIGGTFLSMGTHGADQMMVQRLLGARSQGEARRALVLSGVAVLLQFALFLFVGVTLATFFDTFPPARPFQADDEVFARFIVQYMPVGIVGVTLAAVFAAAMSTLSSSLNSSVSAAMNDFYLAGKPQEQDEHRLLRRSRQLTLLFGLVQITVAIAGPYFVQSVVNDVLAIAGFTTGIILGVFFLGVLTRDVDQRSALVGLLTGLILMSWLKFGPQIYSLFGLAFEPSGWQRLHLLAWPYYTIVGAVTTFLVGWLTARFTRPTSQPLVAA